MKTVKITDLAYGRYEKLRDELLTYIDFAVVCQYSRKWGWGIFKFDDSAYIPKAFDEFRRDIKGNAKLMEGLNAGINRIMELKQ